MTRRYVTQGRILIAELKQRPMTYAQMLRFGQGNSPWKRVAECLREFVQRGPVKMMRKP